MRNIGLYAVGGTLLFGTFWLISESARAPKQVTTVAAQKVPVLNLANKWNGKDRSGKSIRAVQLLAIHKGKLSAWEPGRGWVDTDEKSELYKSELDDGKGILRIEIDSWPVVEDDRAYSHHDIGVVTWPQYVEISVSRNSFESGRTSIVYSREQWQHVGKFSPSGIKQGEFAQFLGIRFGNPAFEDDDTQYLRDYTQTSAETDRCEFSYERTDRDRGMDRRVLFQLRNGELVVARRFRTVKSGVERVAWRAPVSPSDVDEIVLQERPVQVVEIFDLPNPNP